jgi:hypothetical protein
LTSNLNMGDSPASDDIEVPPSGSASSALRRSNAGSRTSSPSRQKRGAHNRTPSSTTSSQPHSTSACQRPTTRRCQGSPRRSPSPATTPISSAQLARQ